MEQPKKSKKLIFFREREKQKKTIKEKREKPKKN